MSHSLNLTKDKTYLRKLLSTDADFEAVSNPFLFGMELVENLAAPDAELRDDLSYALIGKFLHKNLLHHKQLNDLLKVLIDDHHLFYNIGENDTDSVLKRSFSILIIVILIEKDAKERFLHEGLLQQTKERVIAYAKEEQDRRGFIEGKGWAHSVAHTADALDACALHPLTTEREREEIMETVAFLAALPSPLYHMEDDRLSYVAFQIIIKGQVPSSFLHQWLQLFKTRTAPTDKATIKNTNAEHFLRSVYFLLLWHQDNHPFLTRLSEKLKELNLFYRYGILK